jgi:prephenate dehydrogenase
MIGIIGFGRFGKLTARYLSEDFEVVVYSRHDRSADIERAGAKPASLETVCTQEMVLLSVPISEIKGVLERIRPILKESALVIDVCSVKVYPTRWMTDILPQTVSILPTHPMFGPDSAADSLTGRKIFLCKERISDTLYHKIKSYLSSKGLVIIETTPDDHDRQIAVSLSLTHFIGRSLSEFDAVALDIDTEGYKRLLHILDVVEHDTWQLFYDMHRYNPYARENRLAFMNAMEKIHKKLESK